MRFRFTQPVGYGAWDELRFRFLARKPGITELAGCREEFAIARTRRGTVRQIFQRAPGQHGT